MYRVQFTNLPLDERRATGTSALSETELGVVFSLTAALSIQPVCSVYINVVIKYTQNVQAISFNTLL